MYENILPGVSGIENINLIVTHDGLFHADEVTSVALLRLLYKWAGVEAPAVLRTRRPNHLENPDNVLVDVGGIYDPAKGRFDHHFQDAPCHPDTEFRYSSAGMIWNSIGYELVQRMWFSFTDADHLVWEVVDEFMSKFILPVDLADNGQAKYGSEQPVLTYSALISAMNPSDVYASQGDRDNAFHRAVEWATTAIVAQLDSIYHAVIQRKDVLDQLNQQLGKEILVLDKPGPWIGIVTESDDAFGRYGKYKLAIFHDPACLVDSARPEEWRIQSFPGSREDRFAMRCKAPANLKETHPEFDWVFVHPAGFIGGVRGNRETAIKAAEAWIAS